MTGATLRGLPEKQATCPKGRGVCPATQLRDGVTGGAFALLAMAVTPSALQPVTATARGVPRGRPQISRCARKIRLSARPLTFINDDSATLAQP
jgi:hypothetical protein